jgi:exodeoxyribonuclease VII small subunit
MSAKKSETGDKSLREMLDEFEVIVARFDDQNLEVETAISEYESGAKLAAKIQEKLATEKNKIEILSRKFSAANASDSAREITLEIRDNDDAGENQ